MAIPSEVRRVHAAIENNNRKELEWSLWYARMRQTVPSARPADVKYWSGVERQVDEMLNPPPAPTNYPIRKKKKQSRGRGLGLSPLPDDPAIPQAPTPPAGTQHLDDPTFKSLAGEHRDILTALSRPIKRVPKSGV